MRTGKAHDQRVRRAAQGRDEVEKIRDRRRFQVAIPANGIPNRLTRPDATGTIFPHTVLDWSPDVDETVLKSGKQNIKIGGDVLVGPLLGAKIYTLTLEERATCPRECGLWQACYGNSMNMARRWRHSAALETAIEAEVRALCAKHEKVLIRLHVLGDFPSFDYLALWARLLDDLDNLWVFGFTAWKPGTQIGDGVARLREAFRQNMRFAVRTSGVTGEWGSFTIDFPTELPRLGDAIVCPAQRSGNGDIRGAVHCGDCGACWQAPKPIVFIQH
jgi:hypothetical protein